MMPKKSFLVCALAVLAAVTAGAAPVLTVICMLSESCPMMPRPDTRDCHEEDSPYPQRDCCESSEASVPSHQCSRIAAPEVALQTPTVIVTVASAHPPADHLIEVPFRATGPPLLAFLSVLVI